MSYLEWDVPPPQQSSRAWQTTSFLTFQTCRRGTKVSVQDALNDPLCPSSLFTFLQLKRFRNFQFRSLWSSFCEQIRSHRQPRDFPRSPLSLIQHGKSLKIDLFKKSGNKDKTDRFYFQQQNHISRFLYSPEQICPNKKHKCKT